MHEFRVTEERKFAILFAATILAARKLIDADPNKKQLYSVEGADAVIYCNPAVFLTRPARVSLTKSAVRRSTAPQIL